MKREIVKNIYSVGANDSKRKVFDELIPLPYGTSYNSYLVIGSKKTALIDTVDPAKSDVLIQNLDGITHIDYVVINHAEQDHSGSLPIILEKYPMAKAICSEKCRPLLMDLLHIPAEKIITVQDNEKVSLGDKTLGFIYTPWVHWPETMCTYLEKEGLLFSCDLFGSHMAAEDLYSDDSTKVFNAAKRYYAEIMMPFRTTVKSNIQKIKSLAPKVIAPSHGPIYNNPSWIVANYEDWISDNVKNEVLIAYISMHGSTEKLAKHLYDKLSKNGIKTHIFNLAGADLGDIAECLVDSATVIIASPAFLAGAHPSAVNAVYIMNALRPKTRFISIISSFGWGSKTIEQLQGIATNFKSELIQPVNIKGNPTDFLLIDELAANIINKHKEANL